MDHSVAYFDLEGGARLMVVTIPNTITFYWGSYFRAGYRFVPNAQYEMPHLAEHLAFSGTKSYPDDLVFKTEIEKDGTAYNATTSSEYVDYYYVGSKSEIKRIIKLNMSQIYEQLFRDKQIAQEQQVITQEMKRKADDDNWRLNYLTWSKILPQTNPEINDRIDNIAKITKSDLENYHREFYGVANTQFILAGDYSEAEVKDIVAFLNQELKGRRAGKKQELARFKFSDYGGQIMTIEPHRPNQASFSLKFLIPERDEESVAALRLISLMLTGGLSARLLRKAREAGLTYSISVGAGDNDDYTLISVASQTSSDKIMPLMELSAQEITAIGKGDYSDEELERTKGFTIGNLRRNYQVPAQFAGWYAAYFLYGWPQESPEDWISLIEKVTRADIQRAYDKYFKYENTFLSMVGHDLSDQEQEFQQLLKQYFA